MRYSTMASVFEVELQVAQGTKGKVRLSVADLIRAQDEIKVAAAALD